MHYVNKVKNTSQFPHQQFEIIEKLNRVQIIFISEQHSEHNKCEQYWPLIRATTHLQA
jgi:hypothetical protein